MIEQLVNKLQQAENVAIFTHTNPDGDALGSAAAMQSVLRRMGKKASVYLERNIPTKFKYLNLEYTVLDHTALPAHDCALVLDCGSFVRLGTLADFCRSIPTVLCVDHHAAGETFGEICYKDPDSPATAQMVYRIAKKLLCTLDVPICNAIYTGISTDSGHFKYANVRPETFRIAAEILEYGIDHRKITELLYDTVPLNKLIFRGRAAERIQLLHGGAIGVLDCPISFVQKYDLSYDMLEELPNLVLSVSGVSIAVLIKDVEAVPTQKRISLRSKGTFDVSAIATLFGGGGHRNAAACNIYDHFSENYDKLITEIKEKLGETHV